MPKLIWWDMKADMDAVIDAFGTNEQLKKVFRIFFIVMTGAQPEEDRMRGWLQPGGGPDPVFFRSCPYTRAAATHDRSV